VSNLPPPPPKRGRPEERHSEDVTLPHQMKVQRSPFGAKLTDKTVLQFLGENIPATHLLDTEAGSSDLLCPTARKNRDCSNISFLSPSASLFSPSPSPTDIPYYVSRERTIRRCPDGPTRMQVQNYKRSMTAALRPIFHMTCNLAKLVLKFVSK
jgi:hypothetical protein